MNIFSGTEILFFVLGALSATAVYWAFQNRAAFDWSVWAAGILGLLLALFALAWTVTSFIEGESQSAQMGLLLFGLPAVIFFVLANRLYKRKAA